MKRNSNGERFTSDEGMGEIFTVRENQNIRHNWDKFGCVLLATRAPGGKSPFFQGFSDANRNFVVRIA